MQSVLTKVPKIKCTGTSKNKTINCFYVNAVNLFLAQGPLQMLAAVLVSQHLVSSSRTNPRYPLGAQCSGNSKIK